MVTEIAMLHDLSKCTGCRGCMVACKQWKELEADPIPFNGDYQSRPDLNPNTFNLIKMKERVVNGKFEWDFIKFQCMHCGDPGCVKACPTNALEKNEIGSVTYDNDKCIGCKYCEAGCPFNVPHVSESTKKVTKCNLCHERILHGMVPACAKTCTSDAILFGTRDEMTAIADARVKKLKNRYPNAMLYGVHKDDKIKGTNMMYILTDTPDVFDLPVDPQISPAMYVWKDVVHPVGKALIGIAAASVAGATVASIVMKKKKEGK